MVNKVQLTKKILGILSDRLDLELHVALATWWQDPRPESGMRLRDAGHEAFKLAGIECWTSAVDSSSTNSAMKFLLLSKYLNMPYHLTLGKRAAISFYSDREATMYCLYGDMDQFIQALKSQRDRDNQN